MTDKPQVTWHDPAISRREREDSRLHKGCVIWLTGLSGSGKSTIANLIDRQLHAKGVHSYVLDGDNVRHGLNASSELLAEKYRRDFAERFGLGFSPQDREENIRRIGAVAGLFCDAGIIVLVAFVSPYRKDRDAVRASLGAGDFVEVYVDAPLEVCEGRDPKGLYKKARTGEIKGFTGIDAPFEPPLHPELVLSSGEKPATALADEVIVWLRDQGKIT